MALLNDGEIAELKAAWDDALFDTCILQTRTAGTTGQGYGKPSYTNGSTVSCLYRAIPSDEAIGQVPLTQAFILFATGTNLNNLMRIKITHLHGAALAVAQVYEVTEGPIKLHTGQKVKARLVTDGSAT